MCSTSEQNSSGKITEVTVKPVGKQVLDNAYSKYYRFMPFRFSSDRALGQIYSKLVQNKRKVNWMVIEYFQWVYFKRVDFFPKTESLSTKQ